MLVASYELHSHIWHKGWSSSFWGRKKTWEKDEEDDSYYVPMMPLDQNPSRDEVRQKAGKFRYEIAQLMWEKR